MPLPSNLDTIVVYDDYIDNPGGRPVTGTGTCRSTQLRRELASGLTLVPVAKTFVIAEQDQTINGQTIRTGHWEITCPLGVDPDYSGPDAYTFTLNLVGVDPLLATPAPLTVLLTAAMGPRVRLSSLAPAVPVAQLGSSLTAELADERYLTRDELAGITATILTLEQTVQTLTAELEAHESSPHGTAGGDFATGFGEAPFGGTSA